MLPWYNRTRGADSYPLTLVSFPRPNTQGIGLLLEPIYLERWKARHQDRTSGSVLSNISTSRQLFLKAKKEINRVLVSVSLGSRYREGSYYHQDHETTSGNAPNSYESLIKWVWGRNCLSHNQYQGVEQKLEHKAWLEWHKKYIISVNGETNQWKKYLFI